MNIFTDMVDDIYVSHGGLGVKAFIQWQVLFRGKGAAASSLGSAVSCRVEGRAIDTALGQCFIPNSSH